MVRKIFDLIFGILRLCREIVFNSGRIRLSGIKYYLGHNVRMYVGRNKRIALGKKVWLSDNCYLSANTGTIQIGNNVYFSSNCRVVSMGRIVIGNDNLFGPNVVIVDHNHKFDQDNIPICKQGYTVKEVVLGSDIWLGANVVICPGVSICDRVVVGANSVVTKTISVPGVYAGVPAKIVKVLGD